jgi:hypothetical protein
LLRFDPATSTWEVGLLDHAVRRLQSVVLDARTGEILRFVDRPWDFDREGVP